jgi:ectoine hydroxylase-related dioxygenase (phytanoyl-CoA dioxygenase family)
MVVAKKQTDDRALKELYDRDGYVILRRLIPQHNLKQLETAFLRLLVMQLGKVEKTDPAQCHLDTLVSRLDAVSHDALQAVCTMLKHTSSAYELMSLESLHSCAAIVTGARNPLIMSGPSLVVNQPRKTTRKYTAHAEQNWYPKRMNFVNMWFPFIRGRNSAETMRVSKNSHTREWFYFAEYAGYGVESKNPHDNHQYEIPDRFLSDFETELIPDMETGDVVFFSPHLVHASLDLEGPKNAYALTIRAYDFTDDLTLSSNWAEVPYAKDRLASIRLFQDEQK